MWHKFIDGELYVDLKSKEEVDGFLDQCAIRGLRWASGDKANEGTMKKYYGDRMLITYDTYDYINNKRALLISLTGCTDNKQIIKWSDFMNNAFRKEDLRTGDIVKFGGGELGIVISDLGVIACKNGGWIDFNSVKDDLTSSFVREKYDIIAVRRPNEKSACAFDAFGCERGILIYERKEPEEMTLAEVCKLLGKEIKIVKG